MGEADTPDLELHGSYPSQEVRNAISSSHEPPLAEVFRYDVAFFWATKEMTQYSDIDVSNPACASEWDSVKTRAWVLAEAGDMVNCDDCGELLSRMWTTVESIDPADFPFSAAKMDCFLGVFCLLAAEVLCLLQCGSVSTEGGPALENFGALWRRFQLEVEVMLFFLSMPMKTILESGWPVVTLLRHIGNSLRATFAAAVPNECDLLDDFASSAFRARLASLVRAAKDEVGSPYVGIQIVDDAVTHIQQTPAACPFGHAAALLAIARAKALWPNVRVKTDTDIYFQALDTVKVWDAIIGDRIGSKRRFFYDLISTRWPWLRLLEPVGLHPGPPARPLLPVSCPERVMAAEDEVWRWHHTSSPFQTHGEMPLDGPLQARGEALAAALCRIEGLEVLFMSGTSSGFKWGSFTVRGRQAARGLRQLRPRGPTLRARAWNQNCEEWCDRRRSAGARWSDPGVVVHIKYPCRCAIELLAGARHIYDPVDQFALVPAGMHALLGQTSIAARDYAEHPSVRHAGVRVYWHPLHHSNFEGLEVPFKERVEVVGTHTTHNDTELYSAVEEMLQERFQGVQFVHIDPTARFGDAGTHVVSPQQTAKVYSQFAELDVTIMRHAGCMAHLNCQTSREWFCARYKTGQRLVNAFAVGLPTVLWNEQGFLDAVAGSRYPALVARVEDAVQWIARIVSDKELRRFLRAEGLRLARPYALEKISERFALVLADVLGHA